MIGDVRGRGQLIGVELVRDRHSKEPATDEGRAIGKYCFDNGLIFSLRRNGSVLRLVPPATTTEGQIDSAMDLIGKAIESVAPKQGAARAV
jgi:2,2-dialkylglycine decarboxylase (pyruvate)